LRGLTQTENGDVELGDIIVAVNKEKVANADDLFRVLDKQQVGAVVPVDIVRNGRKMTVPVRLTEGPGGRGINPR